MKYTLILFLIFNSAISAEKLTVTSIGKNPYTKIISKIYTKILGELNYKLKVVEIPAGRDFSSFNYNEFDGELMRTEDYFSNVPSIIPVPTPTFLSQNIILYYDKNIVVNKKEDFAKYRVGTWYGVHHFKKVTKSSKNVLFLKNNDELYQMLKKDGIDLILTARLAGYLLVRNVNDPNLHYKVVPS